MQNPITSNDIKILSQAEESHYFDRKSARIKPNDLAKTIIAFANAAGGKLAIGIENSGDVTGFRISGATSIEEFEQVHIRTCDPSPIVTFDRIPIPNSAGQNDVILVLDIAPSTNRVIKRKNDGAVFLRQGDKSTELSYEQIRALEYDKSQRMYEDELVEWSSMEDIDHTTLNRYKQILGTEASDEQVLRSRGFLRNGRLTNAGVLLFAENPTAFLPQARIRVTRYEGTEMGTGRNLNITKDEFFDGPIPKAFEEAVSLIRGMLREFQYLGESGTFEIIPEYPEFAWFEGLVNAITHRDYAFTGDYIRVSMYDDRLEVKSPGKLPNIVTLDTIRTNRYSRNPRIARVLSEFGWVKELNEGVKRIYSEMQSFFLNDPIFSEPNDAYVEMVLENSITSRVLRRGDSIENSLGKETLAKLNEYEVVAVQYVYQKGRITVRELCDITGRSVKIARSTLRGLEETGILSWHGSNQNDPNQYYSLQ